MYSTSPARLESDSLLPGPYRHVPLLYPEAFHIAASRQRPCSLRDQLISWHREYPQPLATSELLDVEGVWMLVAPAESLARWAHHQILAAISSSTRLRQTLVFKGGNALRSAHGSARATKDLDFSVDATITE